MSSPTRWEAAPDLVVDPAAAHLAEGLEDHLMLPAAGTPAAQSRSSRPGAGNFGAAPKPPRCSSYVSARAATAVHAASTPGNVAAGATCSAIPQRIRPATSAATSSKRSRSSSHACWRRVKTAGKPGRP